MLEAVSSSKKFCLSTMADWIQHLLLSVHGVGVMVLSSIDTIYIAIYLAMYIIVIVTSIMLQMIIVAINDCYDSTLAVLYYIAILAL